MRRALFFSGLATSLLWFGCDGGGSEPEDGGGADASAPTDGGSTDGGSPMTDGGTPMADGALPVTDGGAGPACEPTSGSMMTDGYCDLFELAVFDDGPSAVEARLYGRLRPRGLDPEGCAVIDSVEVQEGGVTVGTLAGIGAFEHGSQNVLLARGAALSEMTDRCGGDDNRFGGFGLIIHGRMDGGIFEAHCADAEGGGRWPPALIVSCHENVDERPWFGAYASVDSFMGMSFTSISLNMPHGPGAAITAADSTVHVIPHTDPWSGGLPLEPFDALGFDVSVSEGSSPLSGALSQLLFSATGDPLGMQLCPPLDPDPPGPDFVAPPVMLLRFTGTGERGAFSSEAFVERCDRIAASP